MRSANARRSSLVKARARPFISGLSRRPSRNRKSWATTKNDGWPPRDGVSGIADCPVAPWHARHGARRSSTEASAATAVADPTPARARAAATIAVSPARTAGAGAAEGRGPPRRLAAVANPVHRAVVVVGDEQGAVLQDEDVDGAAEIAVVLDEPREERLHRPDAAVRVQERDDD